MIDNKELEKLTLKKKREDRQKLSKEDIEQNVIEWCTFYRRNLDIFNEDYLEIKISQFQKQRINSWADNEVQDTLASRGSAKSFDIGLFAIDMALLYSACNVLITSMTLNQSNLIIDEKIDKIFCTEGTRWSSPVLCQLRKDGWIRFKKDDNTGAKIVEFGNGSKIFAVNCGDSARGKRSQIVIVDECVLVKRKDFEEIISPTLEVRKFGGRPKDYPEETKQIFLSSAKTKTNWMWTHLKKTVNKHYKDRNNKYGFFAGDIFTAVANGIQTVKQYIQRKEDTDDMSFEQEYLNIFLGSNENSIFKFEDFERNQILEHPFYVRTVEQIIDGEENSYKFSDDWIRIIVADIALATGNDNDNSVYIFMAINKETGERKVENVIVKNGLNTLYQVRNMKRYFYEYKSTYLMMDVKGVGQGVYDLMTIETEDQEYNMVYPAWTVCIDKDLQISSDTVINDKIQRTISSDAKEVIIPYAGTSDLNSQMHLALRKALKDENISLLKDDSEMKVKIEDSDPKFILKSSEEKAEIMLPFIQTKYMINEAISLEVKMMDNGNIKLQEAKRTDVKDRYMTLAMGNLLADKIYNKYNKQNESEEVNLDDWQWLSQTTG